MTDISIAKLLDGDPESKLMALEIYIDRFVTYEKNNLEIKIILNLLNADIQKLKYDILRAKGQIDKIDFFEDKKPD